MLLMMLSITTLSMISKRREFVTYLNDAAFLSQWVFSGCCALERRGFFSDIIETPLQDDVSLCVPVIKSLPGVRTLI